MLLIFKNKTKQRLFLNLQEIAMGWHSFLTSKPWCFHFCCFHKATSSLAWAVQNSTRLSPLPDHLRGVVSSAPPCVLLNVVRFSSQEFLLREGIRVLGELC